MSVWTEVMRKRNMSKEAMDFMVSTVADCAMNIYTFGLVLLEIISGRQPERDDEGASILSWVCDVMFPFVSFSTLCVYSAIG